MNDAKHEARKPHVYIFISFYMFISCLHVYIMFIFQVEFDSTWNRTPDFSRAKPALSRFAHRGVNVVSGVGLCV